MKQVAGLQIWADNLGNLFNQHDEPILQLVSHKSKYRSIFVPKINKIYYSHRLIYFAHFNERDVPSFYTTVDHINRNPLDNRPSNLRALSTNLQNLNRTFEKGYRISNGLFCPRLRYLKEPYYLGRYQTPEKATYIYKTVKRLLFNVIYENEMRTLERFIVSNQLVNDLVRQANETFTTTIVTTAPNLHRSNNRSSERRPSFNSA